jgi:Family of unknown function (DUF6008)
MDMNMGPGGSTLTLDTIGAVLLLAWAAVMWGAVLVLWRGSRRPVSQGWFDASLAVIGLGVIGQIGHVQEHIAQAGIWVVHPNSPPGMTPWGDGLATGFGRIDPGNKTLGMEILHLVGNFIFLAGLVGIMVVTRRALRTKARRWGRMGTWMQTIHGLEHLSLTLSVAFGARAIGLSTWFGLLPDGPGLWTYRVWWHFVANVVGSVIFAVALRHLWRERREIEASFCGGTTGTAVEAERREPVPVA